ncbi:non-canonical purine NTP pyrophosphatase [Enterococcus faecalis]|uniref:non-canonical purine NTP pyrophosphatase n=1 Tax=Enterococcus faecalis TaxID=1351 RepID=UPI001BADB215|nr:non-canonical purine NTP pyrophosphatase [Enterococcus faecalis]MBS0690973.1 non-canonical purine NTP pyrophosphatase [Enterococcus faecalis]
MEIIVGTNNQGKLKEMQSGLKDPAIQLVSYRKYTTSQEQPAETGTTYAENAYLKARFFQQLIGRPVLGDDGGLTLTAFPDLLGIHTSRFFHSANPEEQNRELLHLFEGQQSTRELTLSATLTGELVEPRGTGGYGFDPIIYLPDRGKTLAELSTSERMKISPRMRALRKMIQQMKEQCDND